MKTNGPDDTPSGDLDRKVVNTASTNVNKVNIGQHWSTQAEAEAEAEKTYNADSRIALVFLREKSGHQFRECAGSLDLISTRLKEDGVTIEGIKQMIDRQCQLWGTDPKMRQYLRPETLFGKTKFESYYAQRSEPVVRVNGNGKPHVNLTDREMAEIAAGLRRDPNCE